MSSKFCLRPPFIPRTPAQRYRSPYWLTKFLATGRWNLHDAAATYNTAGLLIGRDTVTGDKAIAGLETACAHRLQQIDEFLDPPPFLMYTFCAAYHMGVTSALIDLDARSKAGSGRAMQLSLSKPYGNGPVHRALFPAVRSQGTWSQSGKLPARPPKLSALGIEPLLVNLDDDRLIWLDRRMDFAIIASGWAPNVKRELSLDESRLEVDVTVLEL
ncbi:uncharacterized protein MYCGRDRAFT_91344 [Zymoseptoria tritici IPO323]|uniref:Uncharacterized protein n=1 Tax=Zymoseptoria tritici (strain CBS 115943 / IPO323) TaxID=336722 RepID=F9X5Z3_ZYMTI|nr:uncharacterized protein MYCGRDRAFT_91344 [Zymoseptoria tritici IPO323]EGP89622.1 hypothetical protein MYCGRDRAFT_91344 [Zymoseptoria tritici IPO323]